MEVVHDHVLHSSSNEGSNYDFLESGNNSGFSEKQELQGPGQINCMCLHQATYHVLTFFHASCPIDFGFVG